MSASPKRRSNSTPSIVTGVVDGKNPARVRPGGILYRLFLKSTRVALGVLPVRGSFLGEGQRAFLRVLGAANNLVDPIAEAIVVVHREVAPEVP